MSALNHNPRGPTDADRARGRQVVREIGDAKEKRLLEWLYGLRDAKQPVPTIEDCRQYLRLTGMQEGGKLMAMGLTQSRIKACITKVWPDVTFQRFTKPASSLAPVEERHRDLQPVATANERIVQQANAAFGQINERLSSLAGDVREVKALLQRVLKLWE